jgi:dihydrofolate synthase/folylpolyglutamate synthase
MAGKRVGLLTSPHIEHLSERVQIAGEPLSEQEFCAELSLFLQVVERSEVSLTYAEVLYAFAFWEFARKQVEYIVVEVGMGGLNDATNVMTRSDKVNIITDIGLDHVHKLGGTLDKIAEQKAGIIGLHNAVFCYAQAPEVVAQIKRAAQKKQADLYFIEPEPEQGLHFLPLFQQRNATLALRAVQYVLARDDVPALTPHQIQLGAMIRIPGRMEVIQRGDQTIIIDGAHNAQKLEALVASVREKFPDKPVAALVAFVASEGRTANDLAAAIKPLPDYLIGTTFPARQNGWRPSRSADELREAFAAVDVPSWEVIPVLPIAVSTLLKRKEPVLLITGSLYMLEAVKRRLAQLAR